MKLITQTSKFAVLLLLLLCSSAVAFAQADLSLRLTQLNANPARYTEYTVTATVTNSGPMATSGVAVAVPLPAGLVFTGGREFTLSQGTYSPYFGQVWEVGTLASGQTATLTVSVFLLAPTAPDFYAQVMRSSATDPDSTPGNGTPPRVNEDDEASTAASASAPCDLMVTLGSVSCVNDNRTPNDPSDDYFVAMVKASSPLLGNGRPVTVSLLGTTISVISLTGTFTEIAMPARFLNGGTFTVLAAFGRQLDCSVSVSGSVPASCTANRVACGFDKTYPGVAFASDKIGSQIGGDYVIEDRGRRLIIAADGSSAMVDQSALLKSNVTFDARLLADGTRYTVQFVGEPVATVVVRIRDANGNTVSTLSVPFEATLAGIGSLNVSDFVVNAGQYVLTGTVTLPGSPGPRMIVARGSLVKGAFALSQLTELVPGAPKAYTSMRVAAVSQSGDVYLEARTADSYDVAKVNSSGRLVWGRTVVAGLNAGNVVYDAEISADGTKLYVASKEATQLLVRTLNTADGSEMGLPYVVTSGNLTTVQQPASRRIAGLLPLRNGNVLVSFGGMAAVGSTMVSELVWISPSGTMANRVDISAIVGANGMAPNPVFESKSGEFVFTSQTAAGLRVIQLRGDGTVAPDCGNLPTSIDLELTVASTSPSPRRYTVNPVTYTITNRGPLAATGVTVSVPSVPGTVLAGGNESRASQGSYSNYGNQVWTVGTLAAGASATLTINYFGLSANGQTYYGQVATATERDSDSTPGNGTNGTAREDDEAVVTVGTSLRGTGNSSEYLRMYPNPAVTGQSITFALDIPVESHHSAEIIVSDLAGRVVARRQVDLSGSTTQLTLDLAGIPSGVYVAAVPELELEPQRLIITE